MIGSEIFEKWGGGARIFEKLGFVWGRGWHYFIRDGDWA